MQFLLEPLRPIGAKVVSRAQVLEPALEIIFKILRLQADIHFQHTV